MLNKITITSAGPLKNRILSFTKANLIIGDNESGKTALTDIFCDIVLTKRQISFINNFSKVTDYNKERFDSDRNFKVEGDIEISLNQGVSDSALALSLPIIRAGVVEFSTEKDQEFNSQSFWNTGIKTLLYGTDTTAKKFTEIKENITVSSNISDLLLRIANYSKKAEDCKLKWENLIKAVLNLSALQEKLKHHSDRIAELKKIENCDLWKAKANTLNKYAKLIEQRDGLIRNLNSTKTTDFETIKITWQSDKSDLNIVLNQITELNILANSATNRISSINNELNLLKEEKEQICTNINSNKIESIKIISKLEAELDYLIQNRISINDSLSKAKRLFNEPVTSSSNLPLILIGIAIGIIGLFLLNFSTLGAVVTFIIGVITILYGIKAKSARVLDFHITKGSRKEDVGKCERQFEVINEKISSLTQNITNAKTNQELEIKSANAQLLKLNDATERLQTEKQKLKDYIQEIAVKVSSINKKKEALNNNLRSLEAKYRDESTLGAQMQNIIAQNQKVEEIEGNINKIEGELKSLFKTEEIVLTILLAKTETGLTQFNQEIFVQTYNSEEFQKLTNEKDRLQNIISNTNSNLKLEEQKLLNELNIAYNQLPVSFPKGKRKFFDNYLHPELLKIKIDSVYSIDSGLEKINTVSEYFNRLILYCNNLTSLINAYENDQKTIINDVLNSHVFKNILSNLTGYEEIEIDLSEKDFQLNFRKGDEKYKFSDLSTGARHQIFIALRFALLQKIYKKPGTLILDDAFIHFDAKRRIKAVELLKQLIESGWQFIYTAVDDKIMDKIFLETFGSEISVVRL